jgi:hypothetical protein
MTQARQNDGHTRSLSSGSVLIEGSATGRSVWMELPPIPEEKTTPASTRSHAELVEGACLEEGLAIALLGDRPITFVDRYDDFVPVIVLLHSESAASYTPPANPVIATPKSELRAACARGPHGLSLEDPLVQHNLFAASA